MGCWVCEGEPVLDSGLCSTCDQENERWHDEHDRYDNEPTELWALGELERVVQGNRLALGPTEHGGPEWDWLPLVPQRTLRRLRGARYMRAGGLQPDWLAQLIVPRVAGVETDGDAIAWYIRTCLAAIDEARLLSHRRRHRNVAVRNGHRTYYEYRDELARQQGYRSLWHMRKEKGWT